MLHELGLQPQFWILPTVLAVLVIITVLCLVLGYMFGEGPDGIVGPLGGILGGLATLILAIATIIVFIPFNGLYQHYYEVDGQVTSVTNSFENGTGSILTDGYYIVTIEGDSRQYVTPDDRLIHTKGKQVSLTCTVAWIDFGNSADEWDCKLRSFGGKN